MYGYIIYQQSRKTAPILSPVSGIKRKLSNLVKPLYRNGKKFGDNLLIWYKVFNIDGDITFNDITIGNKEEMVISMMKIVALRN